MTEFDIVLRGGRVVDPESGMTAIGAAFLAPERLGERGLTPGSLTYAPTGERVASEARLRELRAADPGGLVIIRHLDEDDPGDRDILMRYLLFPGSVVASDAMPVCGTAPDSDAWPLPRAAFTHPRTAGTFGRATGPATRTRPGRPAASAMSWSTALSWCATPGW